MWKTKTLKNKIFALALFICSLFPILIERDATVMIMMLFIAIPLFFAKEKWIL